MNTEKKSHAEQNAEGHAETILELYRAFKAIEDGEESADADGETYTSTDDIRDRVQETALSVEVRSDWHTPGDEAGAKAAEYNILLSTGGPALRIIGELSEYGEAAGEPKLQHQDWGTPWTDYVPDVSDQEDWEQALEWYVGCFYFGE